MTFSTVFQIQKKGVGSVNAEGEANEYETLKQSFTTYFTPKQNSTYEIYKFRPAKQTRGETIDEFHTRLRTLANICDFHDVKQEILTQILHGCLSSRLRRRGLMTNLPLDQLLAEARSYELAECRAAEIEGVTVGVNKVTLFRRGRGRYRISSNRGSFSHGPTSRDQSDRGGSRGHYNSRGRGGGSHRKSSNQGGFSQHGATNTCRYCGGPFPHLTPCPAKGKQCRSCQKIGHFARVCESTNHEVRQVMQGTESDFSDGVDDVQFVFAVSNSVTNTPTVETRICDTNISFFIDTGASINIADYQSYQKIYPRPKLQPHSPMIYAYGSQSALPVIGIFSTQIIHKNANTTSTFYVVKTDSKLTHGNLLSGETAQKLGILQFALSSSMQANVTPMNVSEQFPKLFANGVDKISDIKIKFHIDPSVQPVSQRHRRIPFHV